MYRSSITFSGNRDAEGDPDILYYNATIINQGAKDVGPVDDPLLVYNETRDAPLIRDASKYLFSIVRFSMDGPNKNLPLYTVVIEPNQPNRDLTVYSITLQATVGAAPGTTLTQQVTILWQPEDTTAPLPSQSPLFGQDVSTGYYHGYSYDHFVNLVNVALASAHQQLVAAAAALPVPFVVQTLAPYLVYNPTTRLFSYYCDSYGFGPDHTSSGATEEYWQLFMNTNLEALLTNFENLYTLNATQGRTNEVIIRNKLGSNLFVPVSTTTGLPDPSLGVYFTATQNYPSTGTIWSPIASIVFNSTLLPVVHEQVGVPIRDRKSVV